MDNRVDETNYFALDYDIRETSEIIAGRLSEKMRKDGESDDFSLDPMTIISIANAVLSVIRLIYACYSNNSRATVKTMRNPGFIQRILMKRQIRKHVDRDLVDDLYDSIVEHSDVMSTNSIDNIMMTYKHNKVFKGNE